MARVRRRGRNEALEVCELCVGAVVTMEDGVGLVKAIEGDKVDVKLIHAGMRRGVHIDDVLLGDHSNACYDRFEEAYKQTVDNFFREANGEFHLTDVVDKRNANQLCYALTKLEENKKAQTRVQVAFLQGATPLAQREDLFDRFLKWIKDDNFPGIEDESSSSKKRLRSSLESNEKEPDASQKTLWSMNLGELSFSSCQLTRLADAVAESGLTHIFLECNNLVRVAKPRISDFTSAQARSSFKEVTACESGFWKDFFRIIIRRNRQKHKLYLFSDDDLSQNDLIKRAVKNWFSPTNHAANKKWLDKEAGVVDENVVVETQQDELPIAKKKTKGAAIEVGDRVKNDDRRGVVLRVEEDNLIVAPDDGDDFEISGPREKWTLETRPGAGDVVKYRWKENYGPLCDDASGYSRFTILCENENDWFQTVERKHIKCDADDWRLEFPKDSTGARAFSLERKMRSIQKKTAPPTIGAEVDLRKDNLWVSAVVQRIGLSRLQHDVDFFGKNEQRQAKPNTEEKKSLEQEMRDLANGIPPKKRRAKGAGVTAVTFTTESSKDFTQRLRDEATWCDLILTNDEAYRAKLGQAELDMGNWRFSHLLTEEPVVLKVESWETQALQQESSRTDLERKYLHLVFRDTKDKRLKKVTALLFIKQSWHLQVQPLQQNTTGKKTELYLSCPTTLFTDGLVAAAPHKLQTRLCVF